ncbi:hypothetical protein PIB30_047344 [Stylosanthes scabra]|uniref:CCHC-type domain-containing protein n=1 Tax=Stylosanthes scabra TaxID=79078 RepID=A0ABU6SGL3_9FABA|nr:hypothetical protein [Stylosanthes scabra]
MISHEKGSQSKKPKDQTKLPRKYREFTCTYCGKQGHTKWSCTYKKIDDAEVAEIAAQEAAKQSSNTAQAENAEGTNDHVSQDASEVHITQPNYSQPQMMEEEPADLELTIHTRPDKLPLRRRAAKTNQVLAMDPMQGASSGTAKRMSEVLKFMPTPGFIPPMKK